MLTAVLINVPLSSTYGDTGMHPPSRPRTHSSMSTVVDCMVQHHGTGSDSAWSWVQQHGHRRTIVLARTIVLVLVLLILQMTAAVTMDELGAELHA